MRRWTGHMRGERYLGNRQDMLVHDLEHEKPQCQISRIIQSEQDTPWETLFEAHGAGYDNCIYCLGKPLHR